MTGDTGNSKPVIGASATALQQALLEQRLGVPVEVRGNLVVVDGCIQVDASKMPAWRNGKSSTEQESVSVFSAAVIRAHEQLHRLPHKEASKFVFTSIWTRDELGLLAQGELIHRALDVNSDLMEVIVVRLQTEAKLESGPRNVTCMVTVHPNIAERWLLNAKQLFEAAYGNFEAILTRDRKDPHALHFEQISPSGSPLAMRVHAPDALASSFVVLPSMQERILEELDAKRAIVAIPARGSLLVFADTGEADLQDAIFERMRIDHNSMPYPLFLQLLQLEQTKSEIKLTAI